MLHRVCRRLAELYAQQAAEKRYETTRELDALFQLHSLLIMTRDGCLKRSEWDVKKYREALPYLWLPLHQHPPANVA